MNLSEFCAKSTACPQAIAPPITMSGFHQLETRVFRDYICGNLSDSEYALAYSALCTLATVYKW